MGACETYLRLALKAQAQCRATLETLAEVKNPKPPTFVRQQNVAYQQQVNNGDPANGNLVTNTHAHARTEENNFRQNKLLEDQGNGRAYLDTGATAAASGSDNALETLAELNRAKKRGG
jgi:hypothetical protein